MSLQSVRAFLAEHAPDIEILEATTSTATVALAAAAHSVEPARIAKTLALHLNGDTILLVMSGTARLDNRKYKVRFGAKASKATQAASRQKMIDRIELVEIKDSNIFKPYFNFHQQKPSGKLVVTVENMHKKFDDK